MKKNFKDFIIVAILYRMEDTTNQFQHNILKNLTIQSQQKAEDLRNLILDLLSYVKGRC